MNRCRGSAQSVQPLHWRCECQSKTGYRENESVLGFGAISATVALAFYVPGRDRLSGQ